MEPAAITPETFSFLALFARADWVVKSVMVFLGLASLASWAVILDKGMRLRGLNRAADAFETEAASGRSLEDIAAISGDGGLIVLDAKGNYAMKFNTEGMYRGTIGADGVPWVGIYGEPEKPVSP